MTDHQEWNHILSFNIWRHYIDCKNSFSNITNSHKYNKKVPKYKIIYNTFISTTLYSNYEKKTLKNK
jgi:hypothetical protein